MKFLQGELLWIPGEHRAENYRDFILTLVGNCENLGCNMSLKVHFLDSYMDFFHEKLSMCLMNMVNGFIRT